MATQGHPKATTVSMSKLANSSGEDVGTPTQQNNQDEPSRLQPAQAMSKEEFLSICKKVKWKADLRLIFMAWLMCIFNYFDRVSFPSHRMMALPITLMDRTRSEPQE